MTAAIIISSIAVTGLVAVLVQKFDQEGTDMFKKYKEEENKEE